MNDLERIDSAIELGCPVLASRILLHSKTNSAHYARALYKRGALVFPLPAGCGELTELETRLGGRRPGLLQPLHGIYCVAAYDFDGQRVGAVQYLRAARGQPRPSDSFSLGCAAGEHAAITSVIRQFSLVEFSSEHEFSVEPIPPLLLSSRGSKSGGSAGLAAALATVWTTLPTDSRPDMRIVATGRVDGRGNVLAVDDIRAKVEAVIRETPFVGMFLYPAENRPDIPDNVPDGLVLKPVSSVAEALKFVFGEPSAGHFAKVAPDSAAMQAEQLEIAQRHSAARELACAILSNRSALDELPDYDRLLAETIALRIRGINELHSGDAKAAGASFAELHAMAETADESVHASVFHLNFAARVASFEASVYIDLLQPERAIETCAQFAANIGSVEPFTRQALLGSWARSLTAAGQLQQALKRSTDQLAVVLPRSHPEERFRGLCNRIGALVAVHRRDGDREKPLRSSLSEASRVCADLPSSEARLNSENYLALWQCRVAAAVADPELALQAAPDAPIVFEWWPHHHRHRFVAEALAGAGRVDEAVVRLRATVNTVPGFLSGFIQLVMLTASARLAVLRLDQGQDDWTDLVQPFVGALAQWQPQFVNTPPDLADAANARKFLLSALARFPY